jgi:hypothetical protein
MTLFSDLKVSNFWGISLAFGFGTVAKPSDEAPVHWVPDSVLDVFGQMFAPILLDCSGAASMHPLYASKEVLCIYNR